MNLFHSPEDEKQIDAAKADPLFLHIIREMLVAGESHFPHKQTSLDSHVLPVWASNVYRHLKAIESGAFGKQFTSDYLTRNSPPWDALSSLPYPEAIRDLVLLGISKVVQLPNSERVWHPRSMDEWLITRRPGHPATSGLLRAVRKPDALDRAEYLTDRDAGPIAALQKELDLSDIPALQRIYTSSTDQCRELTYWRQVVTLSRWLEVHGKALGGQFGADYRARWQSMGLVGLVRRMRSYRRSEGHWSGWFPSPEDREFGAAADWMAMECGVYLYLVPSVEHGTACASGVLVAGEDGDDLGF